MPDHASKVDSQLLPDFFREDSDGTDRKVFKARNARLAMARIIVRDLREFIFFSEGPVPSSEALQRQFPHRSGPPIPIQSMPHEEEERQAWLMTLHAYQAANHRGYRHTGGPPLETWIIGRPQRAPAVLAPWFEDTADNYRLLVHRYPLAQAPSCRMTPQVCWDRVYTRLGIGRRRQPSPEFMASLVNFLSRVHFAYREDPLGLPGLFEATGHAYVRSSGPVEGYNRRLWPTS